MIQPADENKYCFDMLVSARAMGSPALSSAPGVTAPRHRFSIFKQGIVLAGRERPLKRMVAQRFAASEVVAP